MRTRYYSRLTSVQNSMLQWRSKVVGTLVKTVQKITKESFSTTIVIFKGTI